MAGTQTVYAEQPTVAELPMAAVLNFPGGMALWSRAIVVAIVVMVVYLLDQLTYVFLDLWLLNSLGFEIVFWTNFKAGAVLFVLGFIGTFIAVGAPVFINKLTGNWRTLVLRAAFLLALVGAYLLSDRFLDFLLWQNGGSFGETESVFNRDSGFFVFSLPAYWIIWYAVGLPMVAGFLSSLLCTTLMRRDRAGDGTFWLSRWLTDVATPFNL